MIHSTQEPRVISAHPGSLNASQQAGPRNPLFERAWRLLDSERQTRIADEAAAYFESVAERVAEFIDAREVGKRVASFPTLFKSQSLVRGSVVFPAGDGVAWVIHNVQAEAVGQIRCGETLVPTRLRQVFLVVPESEWAAWSKSRESQE